MVIDPSFFEQIIADLPDGVTIQDRNFKVIYQNAAVRKSCGCHIGEECFRVYEGRDRTCERCGLEQVFSAGKHSLVLRTVTEADGTTSLWENSCFPLFDTNGEIGAGVEILRNVTDRASLQAQIEERNNQLERLNRDYRTLLNHLPDFIVRYDPDLRRTYVNPAWERAAGLSASEVVGVAPADVPKVSRPVNQEYLEKLRRAFATGRPQFCEFEWENSAGEMLFLAYEIIPEFDRDGKVTSVLTVGTDFSERKKAEDSLRQLNRKLRAISNCNQVLQRAESEQVLLDEICRIVCEEAGYLLAWVGYAQDDAEKSIEPVSWAGRDSDYVANLSLSWDGATEFGQGPAGTAIRNGETILIQDIVTDARMIPWRESALQRGYRAAIALPLKGEGQVFGVLMVYSEEPDSIVPNEIEMLEGLADNLAYGITVLRSSSAHQKAERQISLLSNTLNMVHEAAYLIDDQARFYYVNDEACRALGYSREELLGFRVFDIDPDFTVDRWEETVAELKYRRSLTFETRHRRKDGRIFPVEIHTSYLQCGGEEFDLALARDITERRLMEDALIFVAQRGWLVGAENFFYALAQFLGERLDIDCVVIDRLDENPEMAETLALYAKGAIVPNMRYALKGTPCENVIGRQLCVYPQGVQQLFPEDTLLVEMGAESYIGIPLWDSFGQPIGLIALIDSKPLPDDTTVHQLLQLVATRAAAELERTRSDRILRTREREFRTLAENSPDCIARYDTNCRTVYVNPALEKTLGCPASEKLGKTPLELPSIDEARAYQEKVAEVLATGEESEIDLVLPDRGDGVRYHNVRFVAEWREDGAITGALTIGRDITERKLAEKARNANLWFFESMDKINRAIQGTDDLERMMRDVLDVVLSVFGCDRAYLLYPCAPDAPSWWIPMERTRSEYPGGNAQGVNMPMDPEVADSLSRLLAAKGPVRFGPGTDNPLPTEIAEQYSIKCFMAVAIRPRVDQPWQFGIHQCSHNRQWTADEERLFDAIGHRLADALTSLLSHRDLRKSEAEYRRIVDTAYEGIWMLDEDGLTTFVNARMAEMLGCPQERMLGRPMTDFMVAEDFPDHLQWMEKCRQGQSDNYERRFCCNDGRIIWTHAAATPIFDPEHHFLGLFGMFADITENKHAEEELRKLSQAIEQSPVSIIITDTKGRIEFVNSKFCEISGYSRVEALGENTRIFKTGETSAEEYRQLWQTISAGEVWSGKFHNRRKNGELFWEQATIAPVRDAQQRITHYVAVKEDITERKRLEEQLHQAQKLESIGQLAGGVAHDFNNMLAVILGQTQLALEKVQPNHTVRLNLHQILKATERSAELTRQLLAFARKQVIAPKEIDLNEALTGMLKMVRRLIGEEIDLAWIPENQPLPVNMDPTQIDQILVNLCINARDAISGVGKVTIETHRADIDETYCVDHAEAISGEYVLLTVSDNGRGMDSATLERIFEPFFTTKGIGCGTGLGLATVYGIVKQNHGFINVYSEPAQGTTFKIYLPRLAEGAVLDQKERQIESIARGDETILLVEDEPGILNIAQQMLENYGYRVLTAATPGEAIAVVRECTDEVHLLISDVVMPEMNGPELMKKISSMYPRIRCLYISGYPTNVIVRHGVLKEGVHFLQKPFTLEAIARKVRDVLDERHEME